MVVKWCFKCVIPSSISVQFCRNLVLSKSNNVDWKLMYFTLQKHYPMKEQYGDTLHFCKHCSILFWKVNKHTWQPHSRHARLVDDIHRLDTRDYQLKYEVCTRTHSIFLAKETKHPLSFVTLLVKVTLVQSHSLWYLSTACSEKSLYNLYIVNITKQKEKALMLSFYFD